MSQISLIKWAYEALCINEIKDLPLVSLQVITNVQEVLAIGIKY